MNSGTRREGLSQKNKMMKILRMFIQRLSWERGTHLRKTNLSSYQNYSLWLNRDHLSGHKLYSCNKNYTLVILIILWLILRKASFFLKISIFSVSILIHFTLKKFEKVQLKTSYISGLSPTAVLGITITFGSTTEFPYMNCIQHSQALWNLRSFHFNI